MSFLTHPPKPPQPAELRRSAWQRLVQFRLRTLFVVTTICAGAFAVYASWSHKTRQARAVAVLRQVGGTVQYDFEVCGLKRPAHWPEWMVATVGVDYFADVLELRLKSAGLTDADFKAIRDLPRLNVLVLSWSNVSDADLIHIQGLTRLQGLYLDHTKITDAGLQQLERLTALEEITLSSTNVTDRGLAHLSRFPVLHGLDLTLTSVTDVGLEPLRERTALHWIDLYGTGVTKAATDRLQRTRPDCYIRHGIAARSDRAE